MLNIRNICRNLFSHCVAPRAPNCLHILQSGEIQGLSYDEKIRVLTNIIYECEFEISSAPEADRQNIAIHIIRYIYQYLSTLDSVHANQLGFLILDIICKSFFNEIMSSHDGQVYLTQLIVLSRLSENNIRDLYTNILQNYRGNQNQELIREFFDLIMHVSLVRDNRVATELPTIALSMVRTQNHEIYDNSQLHQSGSINLREADFIVSGGISNSYHAIYRVFGNSISEQDLDVLYRFLGKLYSVRHSASLDKIVWHILQTMACDRQKRLMCISLFQEYSTTCVDAALLGIMYAYFLCYSYDNSLFLSVKISKIQVILDFVCNMVQNKLQELSLNQNLQNFDDVELILKICEIVGINIEPMYFSSLGDLGLRLCGFSPDVVKLEVDNMLQQTDVKVRLYQVLIDNNPNISLLLNFERRTEFEKISNDFDDKLSIIDDARFELTDNEYLENINKLKDQKYSTLWDFIDQCACISFDEGEHK